MSAAVDGTPLFTLDNVRVQRGGHTLLDGVTCSFAAGRVHALIGPNGSGKSTLMRLLARQLTTDEGRITFRGRDVAEPGARAFARQVAYLPQHPPATEGMLVEELVSLGRFPWHGTFGRVTVHDRAKVAYAVDRVGLGDFRGRRVDVLSGGERQRAWLAMLLAQGAICLLLDEPTSALDIAHQIEVLSLVRDLGRGDGATVIVILHDINMAARYCDDILALGAGRIVAQGSPCAIMRPEVLGTIYDVPMGIHRPAASPHPLSYPL